MIWLLNYIFVITPSSAVASSSVPKFQRSPHVSSTALLLPLWSAAAARSRRRWCARWLLNRPWRHILIGQLSTYDLRNFCLSFAYECVNFAASHQKSHTYLITNLHIFRLVLMSPREAEIHSCELCKQPDIMLYYTWLVTTHTVRIKAYTEIFILCVTDAHRFLKVIDVVWFWDCGGVRPVRATRRCPSSFNYMVRCCKLG